MLDNCGENELRTNRDQSETHDEFRGSFESEWTNGGAPYAPLPLTGSDDLYFIQADSGPVKIGRAKNPGPRLRELQVGCFEQLNLVHVAEGRGYEEKVWHWAFCEARMKGEWFRFTDDLDEAIACMMRNERWWDHLTPPTNFPVEDEDNIVDWHIGIHIAIAGRRERAIQMTSREFA